MGAASQSQGADSSARIQAIRFWSFEDVTRIAIQTQGDYKVASDQIANPFRLYVDLSGLHPPPTAHRGSETIPVLDHRVKQIRVAEMSPGKTRVVFDLVGPSEIVSSQLVNPDRLIIEIRPKDTGTHIAASTSVPPVTLASTEPAPVTPEIPIEKSVPTEKPIAPVPSELPPNAEIHQLPTGDPTLIPRSTVIQTPNGPVVQAYTIENPSPSLKPAPPPPLRTRGSRNSHLKQASDVPSPAHRDSAGDSSLVRVFGLKLGKVVIDAGHGGHDTGTIGPDGLMEKDLVLDVAMRLGKLVSNQLGAQVVYTRSDDTFVPLENRTRIANAEKADLFISIHANSSPEPTATGVETYFFNFSSDRVGLDLATRENATSSSSISDLNDLLHRAVLQTKLEESREFAQSVQSPLWASSVKMNSKSKDRGVKQAPFMVLIGATMPSILAEIGFVSNPHDEHLLARGDQRQKIAEALFKGISQYANSLSHVQIARAASE